ncbi:interaptin-like [Benincasa hispida]|uniref:interaptin-like n=1 Tax=Benincasa hispida TaxID=102211 RepID=UPI0019014A07|nr:interaptin-like [Benincasa hispida]
MTVTEKSERANSSNTKVVEIKKEQVEGGEEEEEKDIDLWLNELVKDSDLNDHQLPIEKDLINEEEDEEDAEELERSTKRTRTTESMMKNTAANAEADESEWGIDPLEITEEIVLKYRDFIHDIFQMLKDEQKEDKEKEDEENEAKIQWQKWSEILERAKVLVETLNRGLGTLALEMEWMKSIDEFEKEYTLRETHVPDLLALLRDINTGIESSTHFRLVSDMKNRDEVLSMCLDELERSNEELTEMVEVIQELKELELQDVEEDGEDGEDGEDELVLELEDDEYEELDLEVDEKTE